MTGTLIVSLLGFACAANAAGCLPIEGERILAADLARPVRAFAALDAAVEIALAPGPGVVRRFTVAELTRVARRHGLETVIDTDVCFERPVEPLTPGRMIAALRVSLEDPAVSIELVEFSKHPVPAGAIEFPRSSLSPAAASETALWRGRVRYAPRKTVPVWAKVRITSRRQALVAVEELPAGKPILPSQVRLAEVEVAPFGAAAISSQDEVVGRIPRRRIATGQLLAAGQLSLPLDVRRGDAVRVDVSSGAAKLQFEATAESPGRAGDTILVKNPSNGRRFRARVEGKGSVIVESQVL